MASEFTFAQPDGRIVEVRITDRDDGNFQIDGPEAELLARRVEIMDGAWAVVRQVHGTRVVDADPWSKPPEADGIITRKVGQPIAVHGGDCAPLGFVTDSGPIGVAHVGWRGLVRGVIEAMVDRLDQEGACVMGVIVGPCIGPECYEFSEPNLGIVADRFGDRVRSVTASGRPALDLRAGILSALQTAGVSDVRFVGACTACEMAGFSHRARSEKGRHALVSRILDAGGNVAARS